MGIPGYYKYILKKHPICVKDGIQILKNPNLYLDYNGLIHQAKAKVYNYENIYKMSSSDIIKCIINETKRW